MKILQIPSAQTPIAIPEGKHFTKHQPQQFANWFGGPQKEQFYRETMNALYWTLETLSERAAEVKDMQPDAAAKLSAIHFKIAIVYQCLLPEHPSKYDFPPYRKLDESNGISY